MDPPLESHSSAAEESPDDERDSSRGSAASFSSRSSISTNINPTQVCNINARGSYTQHTRKHLPLLVQKEMSKLFAARCDATQLDLIPFKVVMDIIREHFMLSNKPELLRVLIRLLCQYQPFQGEKEYRKLVSLCDDLLISVDDEVRETFISMIPAPIDYRHGYPTSTNNMMACGHYVRDAGAVRREETNNPLSELVKRPLLSYQTMPAPLFDQPFLKPSMNSHSSNDSQMDPHKYFSFPAPQCRSTSTSDEPKSDFPMIRPHLPPANTFGHPPWMNLPTTLPLSLNNNPLMWFARASGPSPLHSPTTRSQIANPMRHSIFPTSLVPSLQGYSQHDLKKQQILQRKQELMKNIDTLTKLKNLESSMTSDMSTLNPSDQAMTSAINPPANFPMTWLTIPNYCGLRSANPANNDVSRLPHTVTKDINSTHLEGRMEQDGSYYLEQLLKRPETPDCSDPWGNIKKPRRQTKNSPANNLIGKRKKKSKK